MTVPARTPGSGPAEAPDDATTPSDATPDAGSPERTDVDASPVALVEPPSPAELVEGAVATWRAALVEAAGGSSLADIDLLGEAALDLSAAHPSGIAQLFAGRETRLSNLVREGAALSTARRRARAVGARAAAYEQRYGIAPTSLAIGVATWTERAAPAAAQDDMGALAAVTRAHPSSAEKVPTPARVRTMRAPVLLRPVTLHARGTGESDYELELEPSVEVNPVLARALRSRGALLDPAAVARGAFTSDGFDPRTALDRLASLGEAVLEDFDLVDRIVVGTFVHPGQILVDDVDQLAAGIGHHEVLAALSGVEAERERLRSVALPAPVVGDRDPAHERGVGDLDPAQQHVLDVVATGAHLFVDAPAGSDEAGTIAAVVAAAAAEGRTVLYVPGHRRSAQALGERLRALGLDDLVLDIAPEAGWRTAASRRLLGAMTLEAPAQDTRGIQDLRSELVGYREALRGYVTALHATREPWGVSAYDALQHLARLTSTRPAPRTTVRLAPDAVRALDEGARTRVSDELRRAGELGAYSVRPQDTPWYGADLRTHADADVARRRIERLLGGTLPQLVERLGQIDAETGLAPATSVDAWAEQLRMLDGVRASLDVFLPIVFERTAADLVAATASKQWRAEHAVEMGSVLRRRLVKQAKDMVRPGRPVTDLHAALVEVSQRRAVWQAHCPSGGWPRLPDGLEIIEDEYRAVREDLDALDEVLATTPGGAGLSSMPFADLLERLTRLRDGQDALTTLPDRTGLLHRLRAVGLGELVDDLATRRVDPATAPAELDLAWWSSVIEQILAQDPMLAGYDGNALGALSRRYAELDREHVRSLALPVRAAVCAQVSAVLRRHREQAEGLFAELVEERVTSLRDTFARFYDVGRRLRPVLVASPMLVPQVLPASRTVDLVVLGSASHLSTEVALAALARGRQVVVVGDARCASGTAVRELADVLPTVALRADVARRDPYLTAFLAQHGYEGVLRPTPLPDHRPLVRLDVVDGTGMPERGTGLVETTNVEVQHVLELVLDHALSRPDESLAVVTVTTAHAEAVREAVLAEVRTNPALAAFFDPARTEPFVATDLAGVAGLRRDAVILSLGLGRTPHRRVLHTFGALSQPDGDALLLDTLGSSRHRLVVVSCFTAADLDPERLRGDGPRLLRDLLDLAQQRGSGEVEQVSVDPEPDRLLVDLAERLWRHGLTVELDHGVPGGVRIPMVVGHPDAPGRMLVAVLTDDEAYVREPSVRVRDRLLADRLERLGWSVLRVWSAAAFLDPDGEVDRIRRAVHQQIPAPAAPRTDALVLGVPPVWSDDEPAVAWVPPSTEGGATLVAPDEDAATLVVPDEDAATLVGSDEDAAAEPADHVDGAGADGLDEGAPQEAVAEVTASTVVAGGTDDERADDAPAEPVGTEPAAAEAAAAAPALAVVRVEQPALPVRTGVRPDVRRGLPIAAYSDDQLDDLVAWLRSDGEERTRDELAAALRDELGITRRSHRVDTAVRGAITRALA
ncbi:hypothetical protein [Cellulomonas composti]|uniref:Helicase n=1 Tax=Cellulomonas composti TaxID=266130 RepID=A0A511JAL1_9CELL|nr:hypothetical protein [Cellulomonas composti]GEL95018.1 helicase [Cellulomonas composti]